MSVRRGVRLLDVEPDFGAGLSPAEFEQAREQLLVAWTAVPAGGLDMDGLARTSGTWGAVIGALVLDGAVAHEVRLLDRVCTRLLVAGDLVLFDRQADASLPIDRDFVVLEESRLALLDHRVLATGARWPALLAAVFERAAVQDRLTLTQQAISQLPRAEDRLLAFFWMVADRRGQVRQDGVHLRLPVTHEVLGRMVGARRPTVSLALASLAADELLVGSGGQWRLRHDSLDVVSSGPAENRPGVREREPARVLLVGDRQPLGGEGHEVRLVADVPDALVALAGGTYEVLVVDTAAVLGDVAALVAAVGDDAGPKLVLLGDSPIGGDLAAAADDHVSTRDARDSWERIDAQVTRVVT